MLNRLIKSNNAGGGGCTDIVDNYDPFGDSSGLALYQLNGNANDVSGNYNGTASNVTYGTGVFGQAGVFNGSSSSIYINATSTTPLDFSNRNYSISAWVKSTHTLPGIILSKYGDSPSLRSFSFLLNSSGNVFHYEVGTGDNSTISNASVNNGAWHHVLVTKSPTETIIYVDGSFDIKNSNTFISNTAGTEPLKIGRDDVSPDWFNGSIDQVRIFNTALTPLEVEALYKEELCICGGTVDTLDILGDGSCIATYQLDGNANDLSGNYSGTPTNVSYGVGEFDLAGVFNGSSSYIQMPFASVFANQTFTISAWINTNSNSDVQIIGTTYYSTGTDTGWWFRLQSGKLTFGGKTNSGNVTYFSPNSYSTNTWIQVAAVKTLTSITLFENGTQVYTSSSVNIVYSSSAPPFWIGRIGDFTAQYFNGSIDQVRIFNKALNSTEVTTLYNETACTKVTRTAGVTQILGDSSCVAYYKLDGDVTDETNTYNGTVVGTISYADGEFDYAADFDYSNNYINTNCPLLWDNVQGNITPITISCWVKGQGDVGGGGGWIAMAGYSSFIVKTGNQEIRIRTFSNTGGVLSEVTSASILDNINWFHIVAIFNYKTVKLYIDGQFIGEDTGTDGFSGDQQITKNILIGKFNYTALDRSWLGQIDQFRVFNKEVSPSEVTTLYNEGI